ncbi:P-loop containing nucleoside triphosphate hydrolase protein, partial [Vararia minispora EC-137]
PLVSIPRADVFRFGEARRAVLRDVRWTVRDGEAWAVVGSGDLEGKAALLDTLLGHTRLAPPSPPPGGLFPLFDSSRPSHEQVTYVAFSHRPRGSGGAFYDYTARYGAVRDEDKLTLRQTLLTGAQIADPRAFEEWIEKLGLGGLLDLPRVALSNGQTRRTRIVQALLTRPALLILDEPLTGLDVQMRPALLKLLQKLHVARAPRVIMGLRPQDPVPDWVSHVALVRDGEVQTGFKEDILAEQAENVLAYSVSPRSNRTPAPHTKQLRRALVDMGDVNVKYQTRHVLKNINWTIRAGDRWHLQGANGSGKTTLLAVLTGDHPQSYTQRSPSLLSLFGLPRSRYPTPVLRARIGTVSPELTNAWPRARQMTVREAIGTGFDGGFVPLGVRGVGMGLGGALSVQEQAWREARVEEMLLGLGPHTWIAEPTGADELEVFAETNFGDLPAGAQAIVLLMRALAGAPPVVILDEAWAGMNEGMVKAAKRFLREGGVTVDQAVVVVSHWEGEVPWNVEDGVKRFRLEDGNGK